MPDVSVVIPCLDEEKTVGICVERILKIFKDENIDGEVIVVDNGSTDNSAQIAGKAGAKVVFEERKGYGSAYLKGLSKVEGRYIVLFDADLQYNPKDIPKLLNPLINDDCDFVTGSRFKGKIMPDGMPALHRYIGQPLLTKTLNFLFHTKFSDVHCGFKAFTKDALKKMNLGCVGMEFASEITVKTIKQNLKIKEIPVTVYPRLEGKAKLNSFTDGWRHLRFILLFAPNWLFFIPGIAFSAAGLFFIFSIMLGSLNVFGMQLDLHPMIFGAFMAVLGLQIITFGLQAKIYSRTSGFENESRTLKFVDKYFTLEKGTIIGLFIFFTGMIILIYIINTWLTSGFVQQIKLMLVGMTLSVLGIQVIFSSWFLSIIGIEKR